MSGIKGEQKELVSEETKIQKEFLGGNKVNADANSYPARYFDQYSANEKLKTLQAASDLASDIGIQAPTFSSELIDIQRRRNEEIELFQFEAWIESNWDITDPNQLRILHELYPEYWTKREQYIKERYDLGCKYELLQLRGPKNKDELILQYMLSSGNIEPPRLLVQKEDYTDNIRRGWLNVKQWTSDNSNVKSRTVKNKGAFWSDAGYGGTTKSAIKNPNDFSKTLPSSIRLKNPKPLVEI